MITADDIELASLEDAHAIARLSRDHIERGLGWSWTPQRVRSAIRKRECNVAVVRHGGQVRAFGIMEYGDADAHLVLFAVAPELRRRGVGKTLLAWLEDVALVAGIGRVYLETRRTNRRGREFYRNSGYREVGTIQGYYSGRESAVRMVRKLRGEPARLP